MILSNYQGSEDIYRAVHFGAMAYLTKDASGEQLVDAIQHVYRGSAICPALLLTVLPSEFPQ